MKTKTMDQHSALIVSAHDPNLLRHESLPSTPPARLSAIHLIPSIPFASILIDRDLRKLTGPGGRGGGGGHLNVGHFSVDSQVDSQNSGIKSSIRYRSITKAL